MRNDYTELVPIYELLYKQRIVAIGSIAEISESTGLSTTQLSILKTPSVLKTVVKNPNAKHLVKVREEIRPKQSKYCYALYKGDEYLMMGGLFEVATVMDRPIATVRYWASQHNKDRMTPHRYAMVIVDDD